MRNLMLSTALLGMIGGAAFAQTESGTATTGQTEGATTTAQTETTAGAGGELFLPQAGEADIMMSDFLGMEIYSSQNEAGETVAGVQDDWENIGEVNDVILSRDGTVQAVLVDIGGFLGIGAREVAVQMSSLRFVLDDATADNAGDFFLVLNADRAALEGAPEYVRGGATDGAMSDEAATTEGETTDTAAAGEDSAMTDGTMTERTPIEREGYAAAAQEELTTETLTGAPVYDARDESIGDVAELVVSTDGQITDVIVDVGGFLGIGAKQVALPIAEVDILRAQESGEVRIYVPHTNEQLEAMPEYEG